jgi:hypothetical protein
MIHSPDVHTSSQSATDAARAASDASFLQAASEARLNRSLLTRDLFAGGGSASFLPQLLQAHELQLLGGGLSALRAPPAHQDYRALLNGLGGHGQGHGHAHLSDSMYLQQALGGACSNSLFNSLGSAPGHSAPLTMPSQTFASMSSRTPSLFSNASRPPQPNAQEIQDAISTLQAANAASSLKSSSPDSVQAEKYTGAVAPMVVYMECDEESLSDYQCLLRKQIELFEA